MAHLNQRKYEEQRARPAPPRPIKRVAFTPEQEAEATLNTYKRFAQQTQDVQQLIESGYGSEYPTAPPANPYQPGPPVNGWYNNPMPAHQLEIAVKPADNAGLTDSHNSIPPPAQNYFLRNLLIVGLSLVLLLLTGIFIFLLLSHFTSSASSRAEERREEHRPPVHANFLDGLQNMSVFYYSFTSGPEIDVEQRFPPTGSLPDLDFSKLVDFNVCCTSLTQRFVCMSGAAFNHGSIFLDAIIEKNTTTDDVYLLLWVNSNDLIEVACAVRGFFLVS